MTLASDFDLSVEQIEEAFIEKVHEKFSQAVAIARFNPITNNYTFEVRIPPQRHLASQSTIQAGKPIPEKAAFQFIVGYAINKFKILYQLGSYSYNLPGHFLKISTLKTPEELITLLAFIHLAQSPDKVHHARLVGYKIAAEILLSRLIVAHLNHLPS